MNPTLLGGRKLTVHFEPTGDATAPTTGEVCVRQIPIRDYDVGFNAYTDEIALVALLVGQPREFALTLTPESFEEILAVGQEVNAKGFFASCQRRMAAEEEKQIRTAGLMASLPEAQRAVIMAAGKAMTSTPSPDSSSRPPRMRG